MYEKKSIAERRMKAIWDICHSCTGTADGINCDSLDCPVFFSRCSQWHELMFFNEELKGWTNICL